MAIFNVSSADGTNSGIPLDTRILSPTRNFTLYSSALTDITVTFTFLSGSFTHTISYEQNIDVVLPLGEPIIATTNRDIVEVYANELIPVVDDYDFYNQEFIITQEIYDNMELSPITLVPHIILSGE